MTNQEGQRRGCVRTLSVVEEPRARGKAEAAQTQDGKGSGHNKTTTLGNAGGCTGDKADGHLQRLDDVAVLRALARLVIRRETRQAHKQPTVPKEDLDASAAATDKTEVSSRLSSTRSWRHRLAGTTGARVQLMQVQHRRTSSMTARPGGPSGSAGGGACTEDTQANSNLLYREDGSEESEPVTAGQSGRTVVA